MGTIDTIKTNILNGITIIIDRYSYSGIAFSVAKGLDFEWCKQTENGLLKPDIIIYLTGQTKIWHQDMVMEVKFMKELKFKIKLRML